PGIALSSQSVILYGDLNGRGKPGVSTISTLVSLVGTVVLDLILIPSSGIIGAAVASTCAYTIEFFVVVWFFLRHTGLTWKDMFLLRKSDLHYYTVFSTKPTEESILRSEMNLGCSDTSFLRGQPFGTHAIVKNPDDSGE